MYFIMHFHHDANLIRIYRYMIMKKQSSLRSHWHRYAAIHFQRNEAVVQKIAHHACNRHIYTFLFVFLFICFIILPYKCLTYVPLLFVFLPLLEVFLDHER